jgi:hypothetical protein
LSRVRAEAQLRYPGGVARRFRPTLATVALLAGVGLSVAACQSAGTRTSSPTTTAPPTTVALPPPVAVTEAVPSVTYPRSVGEVLKVEDANLVPPTQPTMNPYRAGCAAGTDANYHASCATAGAIMGVVEEDGSDERVLVWRHTGAYWDLVLRYDLPQPTAPWALVWGADLDAQGQPDQLVFALPQPSASAQAGTWQDLEVVDQAGQVSLLRLLQGGFAVAGAGPGLVTYTPSQADGTFTQTLFRSSGDTWFVQSTQSVPGSEVKAIDRGPFVDPQATPGSPSLPPLASG